MGPAGPVVTRKFAYGRVGGKTGLFDCVRPAVRGEAIWGCVDEVRFSGIVKIAQKGRKFD